MKFTIVILTLVLMCVSKARIVSRCPPRYLTTLLLGIRLPLASIGDSSSFLNYCFEPKITKSALSVSSFRCMESIQSLIDVSVVCIVALTCKLFCFLVFVIA